MRDAPPSSFCWFDYETFGLSPIWDRPAQFAAIRTDADLEPIGEPEVLYCRQADDYLPHPAACRVTGMTPAEANARGLPEHRFIERVRGLLGAPGTCSVGYNSVRFDDEFTRHTLFRNLRDPYAHEWKDGASRWDLLDVVRLTRALRPDGIVWPTDDEGRPTNRLEHLATANGLEAGRAHDALADVRVTIALARLIRERQPLLFAHALAHRGKRAVRALLEPHGRPPIAESPAGGEPRAAAALDREPLVLVAAGIPASRHHLALVVPLVAHPTNPNAVIVFDLASDPSALVGLDADELAARLFARGRTAADRPERPGLHSVATNKCPVVVPYRALRDVDAERLGIDRDAQLRRREALGGLSLECVRNAFARPPEDDSATDVDASLYAGDFLSAADRARLERMHTVEPDALGTPEGGFGDRRLDEMLFRFRARNHPDTLDASERQRWREHVAARLGAGPDAPWLGREGFERAMRDQPWTSGEHDLRHALQGHADALCGAAGILPEGEPRRITRSG